MQERLEFVIATVTCL